MVTNIKKGLLFSVLLSTLGSQSSMAHDGLHPYDCQRRNPFTILYDVEGRVIKRPRLDKITNRTFFKIEIVSVVNICDGSDGFLNGVVPPLNQLNVYYKFPAKFYDELGFTTHPIFLSVGDGVLVRGNKDLKNKGFTAVLHHHKLFRLEE